MTDCSPHELARNGIDGLAFCGGGGKGAYHIGVWKALDDLGLTKTVRAVSGTSIGGLNAVLFALGNFEQAKRVWYSVQKHKVFYVPKRDRSIPGHGIYLFHRDGLLEILNSLNLSALRHSRFDVYINVLDVTEIAELSGLFRGSDGFDFSAFFRNNLSIRQVKSVKLNDLPVEEQKKILLATSAIPVVYSNVEIGGRRYMDAGFVQAGNIPVEPLYRNGCRNILILSLREDQKFRYDPKIDQLGHRQDIRESYSSGKIAHIASTESLSDDVPGFLDFSHHSIRDRMISGYSDARKIIGLEDVYMRSSKINVQMRNQMERMFHSAQEIERFINATSADFSAPNVEIRISTAPTEKLLWSDVVTLYGWRVQQDKFVHTHYRVLDPKNICKAWVLNPKNILRALDDYEMTMKFDQP